MMFETCVKEIESIRLLTLYYEAHHSCIGQHGAEGDTMV